ncbi:MAG: OmpA/MotB family protein [Pyrinomonadaceae bacterium]
MSEADNRTDHAVRYGARRRRAGDGGHEHRDRWLVPYADLVTLLFALFVLLYAGADRDRARAVAAAMAAQFGEIKRATPQSPGGRGVLPEHDSLDGARREVARVFASNKTLSARARVSETERGIVISLAEAGFFAPAEAGVRADALALIDELAGALQREPGAPVRVEGHTDSSPIATAVYPSNWELSAARASAVLARLAARGVNPSRLSVAGYGGERPIADNATPEGRALNRRVDVVVLRAKD